MLLLRDWIVEFISYLNLVPLLVEPARVATGVSFASPSNCKLALVVELPPK